MDTANSLTPLVTSLPPNQNFIIRNKSTRTTLAATSAAAAIALVILRAHYAYDWNQSPPAHVMSTLAIGGASQLTLEILASDALMSFLREIESRFAFPLSLIIAQLERNPIGSVNEKTWKVGFSDAYNTLVGAYSVLRIMTIFRKKLSEQIETIPSDHNKTLLCENSFLGTQIVKVGIAASLIAVSQVYPETTPYTAHFGFLLSGHILGVGFFGKGLDLIEKCLEKHKPVDDGFAEISNSKKCDALRILRGTRYLFNELNGIAVGGLFVLLSSQSSLLTTEITNVAIGIIIGSQKWEAEKNLPGTLRSLARDRNTTVMKTQQVWGLGAFSLALLGWYCYMVKSTDEDTKTIEVLTPFIGFSFLSFFATLFLHKKADENSSPLLTSLQFYLLMFRILPLLFLYFTEEFDLNLDRQSIEASERTAFDFDVLGWSFLGLSLGNELAQRPQALLNSASFIMAIFANSIIYELTR